MRHADHVSEIATTNRILTAPVPKAPAHMTQQNEASSPEFEELLHKSWVYRRNELRSEDMSFRSSSARFSARSMLSEMSLADISVIAVMALPVNSQELHNSFWYTTSTPASTPKPKMDHRDQSARSSVLEAMYSSAETQPLGMNEDIPSSGGCDNDLGSASRDYEFAKNEVPDDTSFPSYYRNAQRVESTYDPGQMSGDDDDSAAAVVTDHMNSKDIVALMDHLAIRNAERNARDTETLVTLVRAAAEMRESFDQMKRFLVEQDKAVLQSAGLGANGSAKSATSSRPDLTLPRYEKVMSERKGIAERALKEVTCGKSATDLAKLERMLMTILDNVEDLKQKGGGLQADRVVRESHGLYTDDSLDC